MSIRVPRFPRWVRWAFVIVLASFIFYVSILSVPPETVLDRRPDLIPLDKWRHFIAYAALGYALAYATIDWDMDLQTQAVIVVCLTIFYGIGIEIGQSMIPGRFLSIEDAYANALGGVLVIPWYLVQPHVEFIPLKKLIGSV